MNRRGFTLIELMTTTAIMGLLATIALPKYQQIRKRANGAEVVAAMTAVRAGAYQFTDTNGGWPATAGLGVVPVGLGQYLTGGGSTLFHGSYHDLGWLSFSAGGAGTFQLVYAVLNDAVVCQSTYGLLGGATNADLIGFCHAAGGFVFLWVDR